MRRRGRARSFAVRVAATSLAAASVLAGAPALAASRPAAGRPDAARAVHIPMLHKVLPPDVLTVSPRRVPFLTAIETRLAPGVEGVANVGVGRAHLDGHGVTVMAVDPFTFRSFAPASTAESDALWQSLARGELTASFDLAHNTGLQLGADDQVTGTHAVPMRIGAFATFGIPNVDVVVSQQRARQLGLPIANALVISAPKADADDLHDQVAQLAPKATDVVTVRRTIVIRDAGEFLTRDQIHTVLVAAIAELGKPYVWGATGPDSFDCSGLVGWVYAQAGVAMPRVAAQQFLAGAHVPLSDARPGDLLFYRTDPTDPTYISHVAIYMGDGKLIQAPQTGELVSVAYVDWAHVAGVVRVDPAAAAAVGGARWAAGQTG
ncbi:MAG TPA: C40 family peptidase [Mycobacteriales bacterium]|nr:C40 family peptidase [Mycobacteriales bacterium]